MINLRKLIITVCSVCVMLTASLSASANNMAQGQMPEQPVRQMPVLEEGNAENFMPENLQNQIPEGMERGPMHMQNMAQTQQPKTMTEKIAEYSPTIISMLALVAGFMFIIFYKRKRY